MMESNFLNEQTEKMKREQFQPIKKLATGNSFKEGSINPGMVDTSGHRQSIERIDACNNAWVIYPAEHYTANFTHIQTTINHLDKNSFMKTFIRKSVALAITLLIAKNFLTLIGIAIVIAIPVAWWAGNKWLQDFAFRIPVHTYIFIAVALVTALIALCTVGYHSVKAAMANPVESLRSE